MTKKKQEDKYDEHACEFVNETDCEEEVDEEGFDLNDVEKEHFDEENEAYEQ